MDQHGRLFCLWVQIKSSNHSSSHLFPTIFVVVPKRSGDSMKTFAVKEKRPMQGDRKHLSYVHNPQGPFQQSRNLQLRQILQTKLVIGQPNDRYEQEADHVADMVVGKSRQIHSSDEETNKSTGVNEPNEKSLAVTPLLQRQAEETQEEEEQTVQTLQIQREPVENDAEEPVHAKLIQRQPTDDEEEEALQTKILQRAPAQDTEEPDQTDLSQAEEEWDDKENIQTKARQRSKQQKKMSHKASSAFNNMDSGIPIKEDVRQVLETGMDQDLGDVRVHESTRDRDHAADLGARAFTYKNHIWLGRGEHQSDIHLMAHESTHVLQQGGVVRRKPSGISRVSPRIQGGWWSRVKSVGSRVVSAGRSLVKKAGQLIGGAKDWILKKVAGFANHIPGFHLLTVILGKNPITDMPVPRNAINIIRGIVSLIPGGNAMFENLQKAGVIERAAKWFSTELKKLNLTWAGIKALFRQAWDSLSATDLLSPSKAFGKIKRIFGPPLIRIKNFAVAAGKMVLQFIFEGALALAGKAGKSVMGVLGRGKDILMLIIKDPIGFLGNLLKAVGKGFKLFSANIWKHLKAGLFGWLFGTLSKAGIQMPEKFDLKGIVSLVLQVLGLTYANLRVKLVKHLGERQVGLLESGFEFIKILVTQGLSGAWKKILEYMGSLKELVIGAIKEWVITKIVTAAVTKLATMFNPVGAIIQAIMAIYNTVMFFIERAKQIMALVNAVFSSIANIARGRLKAAAKFVELTLARTIPVIISFLARLLGLGGVAAKVMGVIRKIQAKVNMAIGKLVGFIVSKAKKVFGKGVKTKKEKTKEKDNLDNLNAPPVALPRSKAQEKEHLEAASRAVNKLSKGSKVKSNKDLEPYFPKVKIRYRLKNIEFKPAGSGKLKLKLSINPDKELDVHERMEGTGLDGIKTAVKWETASLGGATVGKKMKAEWLGPDHPQGTPPGTGVQTSLMGKLVTDPKQDGDSKYIRGHLLNDNIGGKGLGHNLYPITGNANKKHHDSIERKVKNWVNTEKYWVSYSVDVDEKSNDLGHGNNHRKNYVNSVFRCRAAIKGTDGQEYDTVTSNITSTFKSPASANVTETETGKKPKVSSAAKAMDPYLSTSKSSRTYVFHGELYDAMASQKSKVGEAIVKVKGLSSGAWTILQKFYSLAGSDKNKNLASILKTSGDKAMFSRIMANANKILSHL